MARICHCGVWLTWEQFKSYASLELPLTVKIGGFHFSRDEAYTLYIQQEYILTYSRIYQVCYDEKSGRFFGREVYKDCRLPKEVGITLRGRYNDYTKAGVVDLMEMFLKDSPHKKDAAERCLRLLNAC